MIRTTAQMALLLALVFEATVYGWTPGIGHLAFWLAALGATATCNRAAERAPLPSPLMFLPSLMFALSLCLYDSGVVKIWSPMVGLFSLFWAVGWNLLKDRDSGALARLLPPASLRPDRLIQAGRETWTPLLGQTAECGKPAVSLLRGVLLAIPLLLVFGYLLSSADAVFARALDALRVQLGYVSITLPLRLVLWLALFSAWIKLWLTSPKAEAPQSKSMFGTVELSVALGSLNFLFLAFLAVQARYLFGGAALVEALGLNYADYARKGFFELSVCIALILPLVMTAYRAAEYHFAPRLRWLGGALVMQAAGLSLSAFRRMLLYIDAYGMSIERFYAAAGILVALAVLAWAGYACFVARDVCWVMTCQTVTVLTLLGCLSLIDVEARVCRYNLGHARALAAGLDTGYLQTLSCDALPVIEEALPHLDPKAQAGCRDAMAAVRGRTGSFLGVSWNLSRARASRSSLLPTEAASGAPAKSS